MISYNIEKKIWITKFFTLKGVIKYWKFLTSLNSCHSMFSFSSILDINLFVSSLISMTNNFIYTVLAPKQTYKQKTTTTTKTQLSSNLKLLREQCKDLDSEMCNTENLRQTVTGLILKIVLGICMP